ncbi:uncharacterized protein LOC123509309 [Portunus trituberculatus]|uniref:uncharacterized protein LOC123509309 n=1 Tax=Portunus trituberculatus TaxID=210409 RepID=UPI001E1CCD33|nr:uncharacterized protein LOC123509309 [Portunus trituberculatus]
MLLEPPPPPPPPQESKKTALDEKYEGMTEPNHNCYSENGNIASNTHKSQTPPLLQPPRDTHTPSRRLGELLKGINVPGDSETAPEEPPWLDKHLFETGRRFYKKFLFCLNFSELLTLVLVLCQGRVLKPLVFTGRSDTPAVARRRYFSTLLHLISWFEGDVWDKTAPSHKDLMGVRRTHLRYGKSFNSPGMREKVLRVSVEDRGHPKSNKGIEPSIDTTKRIQTLTEASEEDSTVFISQLDMALTQYSFMGLILAHPGQLGAAAATEEEFKGLVHFWRGLGWLLGIKDQFNFCSGSVEETRELCLEVERHIFLPRLSEANWDYEHMVDCLISGIGQFLPMLSLPAMFKYLSYTLDIPTPSLSRRMSWRHVLQYWMMRFTFGAIYYYPKCLVKLNVWFRRVIHKVLVNDRLNLLAYRKGQADLAVPLKDFEGYGVSRCPFSVG